MQLVDTPLNRRPVDIVWRGSGFGDNLPIDVVGDTGNPRQRGADRKRNGLTGVAVDRPVGGGGDLQVDAAAGSRFRPVDLLQVGDELILLCGAQARCGTVRIVGILGRDDFQQGRSGTIMQVWGRAPNIAQCGRIDAQQRAVQALTAGGLDRANAVHQTTGAIGKACTRMAVGTTLALEERLTSGGIRCQRAIRIAEGAGREGVERGKEGRQGIEIGRFPSFCVTQRTGCGAGVESGVAHKARAAKRPTNIVFEILNFIKVSRPVDTSLANASATHQRDGVAQTFAAIGEVPNAAIVVAIEVTGGATDIGIAAHASVD